jgi:hypothetical protein
MHAPCGWLLVYAHMHVLVTDGQDGAAHHHSGHKCRPGIDSAQLRQQADDSMPSAHMPLLLGMHNSAPLGTLLRHCLKLHIHCCIATLYSNLHTLEIIRYKTYCKFSKHQSSTPPGSFEVSRHVRWQWLAATAAVCSTDQTREHSDRAHTFGRWFRVHRRPVASLCNPRAGHTHKRCQLLDPTV